MISVRAGVVVVLGTAAVGFGGQAQPPLDYERGCMSAGCHDEYGQRAFVHDPVASESCDACHTKAGKKEHRFELVAKKENLCTECHEEYEGEVVHSPVADGDCTACHDPHGSATKYLLRAPTAAKLCGDCHETVTDRKYLHGPVAAGACTVCHNPHASDRSAMLSAESRAVCVKCHEAMEARIGGKAYQHAPATEECIACHDPHGGDNQMNLKATPPELCLDCHDDIADVMEEATVKHDALTAGKSCAGCHESHASDVEPLLLQQPMDLCLSCHNKEVGTDESKIIDVARLLSENPNHHGSIREKNCTACHVGVHGGEYFRLLSGEYPLDFYAPFEERRYAFCFSCHEADVVRDERTDKLTSFRNGDQNLHYLHVNRKVKGRTCRACHNTHASSRPKHIAESVPFGSWEIPINYEQTATGGLCLPGCHRLYRYDRDSAVTNLPPR